jgi:hypothetical protein
MNHDTRTDQLTALTILETGGKQIDPLLNDAVRPTVAEREAGLGSAVWAPRLAAVGEAAANFLDVIGVADVLVAGLRKYGDLTEAARATRDTTESRPVILADRTVSLRQHPRVDVTWGERTIASLLFEVVLEIQVQAVTGQVRGGSLVSISGGPCIVVVSIETRGLRRTSEPYPIDPHVVADLGDGIRLVP